MKLAGAAAKRFVASPDPACALALVYGEDPGRVSERVRHLLEAWLGPKGREEMRLDELEASSLRANPSLLSEASRATGFFPGARSVLVAGASDALLPAILIALREWKKGDALIVLQAGILPTRSKLRKFAEAEEQAVALPVYSDPPDRAEVQRVLQRIGHAGKISREAEQDLLSLASVLPPRGFENFCQQLLAYVGSPDQEITPQAVTALAPRDNDAGVDLVVDLACEGRRKELAEALTSAFMGGIAPTSILIAMSNRLKLLRAAQADPRGGANALSSARPPVFGPRRERILRQLGRWRSDRLQRASQEIIATDLQLRSTAATAPAEALTARALIRIASLVA